MKRKILCAGIICLMGMMPVFATEQEMVTQEVTQEVTTDEATAELSYELPADYVPDDERFESEVDRQKKILEQEGEYVQEGLEPTEEKWGGYATYQEYLEANKVDSLTEEQAAAGYSINEYGQLVEPDEAANGESYSEVIMGGVNPGPNTGYVTIRLSTEANIHEEVYVHVISLHNFKIYGCNLYEINGYETTLCLPAGVYQVQEVAPTLDGAGRFFTYNKQFKVEATDTQILEVAMIDREAAKAAAEANAAALEASAQQTEEAVTQQENTTPQPIVSGTSEPETQKEKKLSPIAIIIAVVLIAGLFIGARKIFPESKKHEFRGFDE